MYRAHDNSAAVTVENPPTFNTPDSTKFEQAITPVFTAAIAGADPIGNTTLRSMLEQTGLVKNVQEWSWLSEVKLQHAQDVPDVVFLDLSTGMGSEFVFAQELSKLRPSVHIIACSLKRETDPEYLLQAMRAGIREFLQKPFNRVEVSALVAGLAKGCEAQPVKKKAAGKLFAVLGTKGGVGTSTVAVNFAVQLAQISAKRTVLLDFSRPMGDVAALLDLEPAYQLRDAAENTKRMDASLLNGYLTTHASGLRVLCGAARLEDLRDATLPAIERIVEVAQQNFDFVVMDLGSFYSPEWQNILSASDILLVSEADLTGLAKLHKHLGALADLGVASSQVRLIINRWHRHDEEALAKIENDMRMPVFARLPNNFKQVNEATVRGVPLTKNGNALAEGFEKIAGRLAGIETETETPSAQKKSRLAQFFSLKPKADLAY